MIASGTEGTCSWTITDSGGLYIDGGTISNSGSSASGWSWNSFASLITSVVIRDTVTFSNDANCARMFYNFTSLTSANLAKLDVHNVKNMRYMFSGCQALISLDLRSFVCSKLMYMNGMFRGCKALKTLYTDSSFTTASVVEMSELFSGCQSLTSLSLTHFDTSNVTDMSYMFNGCQALTSLNITSFTTSDVTTMRSMFNGCSALESLDLTGFNTLNVTDMSYMFYNCKALTSLDITSFTTSDVTAMRSMFHNCSALESLDLTGFNTLNVTDMSYMFNSCKALTSLDITSFTTSNVTTMKSMFSGCQALTSLTIGSINAIDVTDMSYMFNSCIALTSLDASKIRNTSNVQNMSYMFYNCSALTSLDFSSSFSVSSVTNASYMFAYCTSLTHLDFANGFNTLAINNMSYMFFNCKALTSFNFHVGSAPSDSASMFTATTNDIYIIYEGASSESETSWKNIALRWQNVHYGADDNPKPDITFKVDRVGSSGDETHSDDGPYAYLQVIVTIYNSYIPYGWSIDFPNDSTHRRLNMDGVAITPTWNDTSTNLVYTCKAWHRLEDMRKHTFDFMASDSIEDENNVEIIAHNSNLISAVLAAISVALSVYHNPVSDSEGVAIGKYANTSDLFEVAWGSLFNQDIDMSNGAYVNSTDMTQTEVDNFVDGLVTHGTSLVDFFYPVGSYYETSDTSFDPNTAWGGTWELETEGLVHVSAGSNYTLGDTGGSKDAIVPTHTHSVGSLTTATTSKTLKDTTAAIFTGNQTASSGGMIYSTKTSNRQYQTNGTSDNSWQKWTVDATHSHTINGFTVPTPSNASALENANMQPYIVVNRWHRTA